MGRWWQGYLHGVVGWDFPGGGVSLLFVCVALDWYMHNLWRRCGIAIVLVVVCLMVMNCSSGEHSGQMFGWTALSFSLGRVYARRFWQDLFLIDGYLASFLMDGVAVCFLKMSLLVNISDFA